MDAVRAELAAEESAPAAPVGCGIPSVKAGSSVTTKPRSPGSTFDRWGRRVGTRGVVLTAPQTSTGGDVVSVRLEDGSVLPYPVDSLETEVPAAEVAVSITGLSGSPARVAAELRQLAEKVESGWLGTSSARGCDVAVARVSSELCACKVPSRYTTHAAGPCWACGRHVPARSGPGGA